MKATTAFGKSPSIWSTYGSVSTPPVSISAVSLDGGIALTVANFHPYLGPVIFFVFACLANTLFITVVVAILSTTFAELNADAKAEVSDHYRRL